MVTPSQTLNDLRLFFLYLACGLLVVFYVNLFPVWIFFSQSFSDTFINLAPLTIPPILATTILLIFYLRNQHKTVRINWLIVILGLLICFSALLIPDPTKSAKRIHVSEYLLLSLLARYVMSHRIQNLPLLVFSILFAALLGIHDEFLQGLHPNRTYGLRDMAVNGVAAAGGGIVWHGLSIFTENRTTTTSSLQKTSCIHILYLTWLLLAVLGLIIPLYYYRSQLIPAWPSLPLFAGLVFYCSLLRNDNTEWSHGIKTVSLCAFSLLFYPIIAAMTKLVFY